MPGSLDSSVARSSMAPTLERQLEREVEPARELPHFAFGELGCFFLRLVDSDQDQIFEHLDILRIGDAGIDFDPRDSPLTVGLDAYHPAACRRGNSLFLEVGLH